MAVDIITTMTKSMSIITMMKSVVAVVDIITTMNMKLTSIITMMKSVVAVVDITTMMMMIIIMRRWSMSLVLCRQV